MKKFDLFLGDLSNWYIRRNRRRFWKTEDDKDKITAYFVLYSVLLDTIKTMAPILPFVCEEMYQNLVTSIDTSAPESIHLCNYPKSNKDYIDHALMEKVDVLRRIVEYGRSARNKSNIRIRQPLSELKFSLNNDEIADFIFSEEDLIMDELNVKSIARADSESDLISYKVKPNLPVLGQKYGKDLKKINQKLNADNDSNILEEIRKNKKYKIDENIFILREDLLIEQDSVKGWTCTGDDSIAVGLSKDLSDDLIKEGIIRDVIRQVQTMRKNANFAVEDRIKIYLELKGLVGESIKAFEDLLMSEVLAVEIIESKNGGEFSGSFEMENQVFTVGLERVVFEKE
jgi:isoleucyl-tRNA synthetase